MKMKGLIADMAKRAVRLVSGENLACVCCGAELFSDKYFCERCLDSLPFNAGYICDKCGRAIADDYPVCPECKAHMPDFTSARSAFVYSGEIVRLIKEFKTGEKYLAEAFADRMFPILLSQFRDVDMLAFVPMTPRAVKARGYNQAELLANVLSERCGIPLERELLVKTRETAEQKELSAAERAKNLRGSFRVHERAACRGKIIVLIDDVLTTGATASAAAKAILRAGALCVHVLTIASVPERNQNL